MRIYILLTFVIIMSCNNTSDNTQNNSETVVDQKVKIVPADLIGKTIEYKYGESIYHVIIDTENTMHWKAVAGDEKGIEENETYKIESIDDSKLFITWGEANGIGVSQVLNFEKGIVHNHLLRGRDISIGEGEIRILP